MKFRDWQEGKDSSSNGQSRLACGGLAGHVPDEAFGFARRQEAGRALGREDDDYHEGAYKGRRRCRGEMDDRAGLSRESLKHSMRRAQRRSCSGPGAAKRRGRRFCRAREGDTSAEDLPHSLCASASLDRGPNRSRVGREGLSGTRRARVAAC